MHLLLIESFRICDGCIASEEGGEAEGRGVLCDSRDSVDQLEVEDLPARCRLVLPRQRKAPACGSHATKHTSMDKTSLCL